MLTYKNPLARELLPFPRRNTKKGTSPMRLAYVYRNISGALAQEYRLSVTANNLANVATPGFKKDIPVFKDFMVFRTQPDLSQGQLERTDRPLDLALSGPGFFQVDTPNGPRYTRNGALTLTGEGLLVTQEGWPVAGEVTIPAEAKEITVTPEGEVLADGERAGAIELVEFEDPKLLEKEGYNLFRSRDPNLAPQPAADTRLEQGYLETSNVNVTESMIHLIDLNRCYEAYQKIIQSFEETDTRIVNDVGRLY